MENSLEIKMELPRKVGESCAKSIRVAAKNYQSSRSKVEVSYNEKKQILEIKIKAKDLSALRAAMNTYLRWVIICQELLQ